MVRMIQFLIFIFFLTVPLIATAQVQKQASCRVPSGLPSNLAVDGGRVCVDADPGASPEGQTVRLVGYGIVPVTIDDRWRGDADCNSNCDPDANTCSSAAIKKVLSTLQLDTTGTKSGVNLTRTFAIGGSCNVSFSAPDRICRGFSNRPELMPFERLADGRFNVKFVNNSAPGVDGNLNKCWEARFRFFLKETERNGLVVIVSLFDENTMTGTGDSTWHRNPWNPNNNNMGKLLPTTTTAIPHFYRICSNMEALTSSTGRCADNALNALGKIQKKYVTKVVEAVQKSGVRNVILEVTNQGRLEDGHVVGSHAESVVLAAWHNTVANWFPDYLWVASVKKSQYPDMRRLLHECRSNADCMDSDPTGNEGNGNPLLVFWRSGIDIIKPHFAIWSGDDPTGDFCNVAPDLFRFQKPVMIDNDGGLRDLTNDNRVLLQWATSLCGSTHGELHLYHVKDGTRLKGKEAPVCEQPDNTYIDCTALDNLASNAGNQYVGPTDLCGKIVDGLVCPPKSTYCNVCSD